MNPSQTRIAVIGAGAIGCTVAAYLTKAGVPVTLVGKKEQVDAIRSQGLCVKGCRGEEIFPVKAETKLSQAYDWVIFTVKTQDLEDAYNANADYLEEANILTTQNGVQADTILSCHFDREQMYSSIVMFGATYLKPGEVVFNFEGDWIMGRPYLPVDPKLNALAELICPAFPVVISQNITGMKWCKLFVNFNNCLPALIGKSMQETFADMDFCRLSIRLLKEGMDIVQRAKISMESLPAFPVDRIYGMAKMPLEQAAGIINKTLTTLSKEPLYGSILQSIRRKKTSEIDFINGEVVLMAKQLGTTAPLNEAVVAMVHEVERRGKFFDAQEVKQRLAHIHNEVSA